MNVFTGTLFTIAIVLGWLMFFWWLVIVFLGSDVRSELHKLGAVLPEYKKRYVFLSGLVNMVSVALTAGYFFTPVYSFYQSHQLMVVGCAFLAVFFAVGMNDRLHHTLLHHIYCLDGAKKVAEDTSADSVTVGQDTDESKSE